jgi:hypothetical protein
MSVFLRNRLFLTWGLAIIPAASLVHLAGWFGASIVARAAGVDGWFSGVTVNGELSGGEERERDQTLWCMVREMSGGQWVGLGLRALFIVGLLVGTFFVSLEAAGPQPLELYF